MRKASKEKNTWSNMIRRCNNPKHNSYKYYGARGIKVCERWRKLANFRADMGPPPTPKHSIDRINPNGDYEPGNCRWATPREQGQNRRPPSPERLLQRQRRAERMALRNMMTEDEFVDQFLGPGRGDAGLDEDWDSM